MKLVTVIKKWIPLMVRRHSFLRLSLNPAPIAFSKENKMEFLNVS